MSVRILWNTVRWGKCCGTFQAFSSTTLRLCGSPTLGRQGWGAPSSTPTTKRPRSPKFGVHVSSWTVLLGCSWTDLSSYVNKWLCSIYSLFCKLLNVAFEGSKGRGSCWLSGGLHPVGIWDVIRHLQGENSHNLFSPVAKDKVLHAYNRPVNGWKRAQPLMGRVGLQDSQATRDTDAHLHTYMYTRIPTVLENAGISNYPGKSWKSNGFLSFSKKSWTTDIPMKKSWGSPGILWYVAMAVFQFALLLYAES